MAAAALLLFPLGATFAEADPTGPATAPATTPAATAAPSAQAQPPATAAPRSAGERAIADKAAASADALGEPTSAVTCSLAAGGCMQAFQGGTVYWSADSGAHWVNGAIRDKWAATGGEGGHLGYPTSDERCGLAGGGCLTNFQGGTIYWSANSGAHYVRGAILNAWGRTGWEAGTLGYPTGDERCGLAGGGCLTSFQGGTMYWGPDSDAHYVRGAILNKWGSTGWEAGHLGYPTSDERCGLAGGGCLTNFQGGTIYWSPNTEPQYVRGAILNKWGSTGWEAGHLGYPTSDERCGLPNGGCLTNFEYGNIYWSPNSDAHWTRGAVQQLWGQRGWEGGRYGYPTSDPFDVSGKVSQRFEGGFLTSGVDTRCLDGRTMCASKNDRQLRWMIDGEIVQTLDARFGCASSPSDNGQFEVYWKSYDHTSTLYGSWMPRAMFYNGGEAVHYSSDFASRGYAGCSHGCVNIRDWDGINWLYGQVREGDKVVVYN